MNILLVGAGQIGSRHLQGFAMLNPDASVTVMDPSSDSLKTAEQRYKDVSTSRSPVIKTVASFDAIPTSTNFDMAIIATDAKIRKMVTDQMLQEIQVKKIIFEKVLFQKKQDYTDVLTTLKTRQIPAWVNCPMRVWPGYKTLKQHLAKSLASGSKIKMTVSGGQWGLACNSIHYLDLFSYLTGLTPHAFDTSAIDQTVRPSKRTGFYELTGELSVRFSPAADVILTSDHQSSKPVQLTFELPDQRHIVKEDLKYALSSDSSSQWTVDKWDFSMPYQSQLTGEVVQKLVETGQSDLPTYEASMKIHLPMIESFSEFFNAHLNQESTGGTVCPIT